MPFPLRRCGYMGRLFRNPKLFIALIVFVLAGVGLSGVGATRFWATQVRLGILEDNHRELTSITSHLNSTLAIASVGARNLAQDPTLVAFIDDDGAQPGDEEYSVLDLRREQFEAQVCYLMDRNGYTRAATNRNTTVSFVGKRYEFRPYFQDAIAGSPSDYFALGVTSRKRGYYASHPIRSGEGEVIGVAVMKYSLDDIEERLLAGSNALFLNREGGVLMASDPRQLFRVFEPQRGGGDNGAGSPLLKEHVPDGGTVPWNGEPHLLSRHSLDLNGRELILLNSMRTIDEQRALGHTITLLLMMGALSLLLFTRVRRSHLDRQDEAERRIDDKDREYQTLFNELASGFLLLEPDVDGSRLRSDFIIRKLNPAFEKLVGKSSIDLLGNSLRDTLPSIAEESIARIASIVVTGEPRRFDLEAKEIDKVLEVTAFSASDGHIAILLGDVSDRTRVRHALEEAKETAEAASLAKSSFLANMSHEIRTPMSGVIGMLDLLMQGDLSDEQREQGEVIQSSAQALLRIINDILDLSKIEADQLTLEEIPFDLHRELGDLVDLFRAKAQARGILLRFGIDPETPAWLRGDPVRLRQVVGNLLGNALKFTEEGWVGLEIGGREERGRVALTISVTDTGIGIPREKLTTIFQEFGQADESTTRRFGGTGLGLSISSKLVRKMGGDIEVVSQPDAGSRFLFTLNLPVASPPEEEESDVNEAGELLDLKVLLAEDNRVNQRVVTTMLERLGCKVLVASNGSEAVKQATENTVDLVLMDVQMPEMSGLEATQALRERGVTLPIVALTANAMASDRDICLSAGMDDFLTKPIRFDVLREALGRWSRKPVAG